MNHIIRGQNYENNSIYQRNVRRRYSKTGKKRLKDCTTLKELKQELKKHLKSVDLEEEKELTVAQLDKLIYTNKVNVFTPLISLFAILMAGAALLGITYESASAGLIILIILVFIISGSLICLYQHWDNKKIVYYKFKLNCIRELTDLQNSD